MQPPPPPTSTSGAEESEQSVQLADSVVAGGVVVQTITHNTTVINNQNNRTALPNISLLVIAIILSLTALLSDGWLVDETTVFGTSYEIEMGLDDIEMTICDDGECESEEIDLSDSYDECSASFKKLEIDSGDGFDSCAELGKQATAGLLGMVFLVLAMVAMLASVAMHGFGMVRSPIPFTQFSPFVGSALSGLGILLWWFLFPDVTGAELGIAAYLAITAVALSAIAGFTPLLMKYFFPSGREAGLGVRSLGGDDGGREFVLKESYLGDRTLSIIEDEDLVRISQSKRDEGSVVVEERFMTKKEALAGFSHHRYDWLDSGKQGWWAATGLGLVLLFFYPAAGAVLFLTGLLLSLAQFTDPEVLIFETNAGQHRILLYRIGSNRELTNASMDLIDGAMEGLLLGNPLDCDALNERANQIESDYSKAIAASEEIEAAAAPVPLPTPSPPPPAATPMPVEPAPPQAPQQSLAPEPTPEVVSEQEPVPEPEPEP